MIIYFHSQVVVGSKFACDVEGVGCVAALVCSKFDSIEPNPSRIEGRSEMQLNLQISRLQRHCEGLPIPGFADIAVLSAEIPCVWQIDGERIRWRMALPIGTLADGMRIRSERPITIEIDASCGAQINACSKNQDDAEGQAEASFAV